MSFGFVNLLRKWIVFLFIFSSFGSLVVIFGTRLPDQEVCIVLFNSYGNPDGSINEVIFDSNRGQYTRETRDTLFSTTINAPDDHNYVTFKLIPRETERYDIYLNSANPQIEPVLLQHDVWIVSGNLQLVSDQTRWSRDSKKVAFLWRNREKDLYLTVVDVESHQSKTVTPFERDPNTISYTTLQEWSADGQYVSLIEQVLSDTRYSFWNINTLTPISYPLSTTSMVRGVWSPQGHIFAAIVEDEHQKSTHLMILNPDDSQSIIQTAIPNLNIQHLMWSPDGKYIVIGHLASICENGSCQKQQWHYKLFQADGKPVATDLVGSLQNSGTVVGNSIYNSDGHVAFSGYDFNATWSSDGKDFIYLEQAVSSNNSTLNVQAFKLENEQTKTIATYETINSSSIFHTLKNGIGSTRIPETVPFVPVTDQIIIPMVDHGKISLALSGGDLEKQITLVSNADQIESLSNMLWQQKYWTSDWYGNDHILIAWSTGQGADKDIRLVAADANGENIQTFEDGWTELYDMNFVPYGKRMVVEFVGRKGTQFNLYTIDLDTGKQTLLLKDIEYDTAGWQITFNPQLTLAAIKSAMTSPKEGKLYLVPADGGTPVKIDADASSLPIWSEDGEQIAFTKGMDFQAQYLRVARKDGTITIDSPMPLANRVRRQFLLPWHWSKCY